MALSEANSIKVCQILGITTAQLEFQLDWIGARFTAAVQAAVEDQIDLWDAGAGTDTTSLYPTESNRGVKTDAYAVRKDIQRNIAVLLQLEGYGYGSAMRLDRG